MTLALKPTESVSLKKLQHFHPIESIAVNPLQLFSPVHIQKRNLPLNSLLSTHSRYRSGVFMLRWTTLLGDKHTPRSALHCTALHQSLRKYSINDRERKQWIECSSAKRSTRRVESQLSISAKSSCLNADNQIIGTDSCEARTHPVHRMAPPSAARPTSTVDESKYR